MAADVVVKALAAFTYRDEEVNPQDCVRMAPIDAAIAARRGQVSLMPIDAHLGHTHNTYDTKDIVPDRVPEPVTVPEPQPEPEPDPVPVPVDDDEPMPGPVDDDEPVAVPARRRNRSNRKDLIAESS
jgi:hypothetical protein